MIIAHLGFGIMSGLAAALHAIGGGAQPGIALFAYATAGLAGLAISATLTQNQQG